MLRGISRWSHALSNRLSFSTSATVRLTPQGDRLILGIETSCDDSCVALLSAPPTYTASSLAATPRHTLHGEKGTSVENSLLTRTQRGRAKVLVSKVYRQDHSETQGIHPLVAQHYHMSSLPLALADCLAEGGISADGHEIDGVAVTQGPGMPGCLGVGLTTAKTLAAVWKKPLIPVHHMEAHALTPFLTEDETPESPLKFPFLTLLLSGGHTMLVFAAGVGRYTILASTGDDSIGDAFDKAAKRLAIPTDWMRQSPGASLEAFAAQAPATDASAKVVALHKYTIPVRGQPAFSYSGLKSAFNRHLDAIVSAAGCEKVEDLPITTRQLAAQGFQAAAFDQLEDKLQLVLAMPSEEEGGGKDATGRHKRPVVRPPEWDTIADLDKCNHLVVSGGVAANKELRRRLASIWKEEDGRYLLFPPTEYCVDNAAMIAHVGLLLYGSEQRHLSPVEEDQSVEDFAALPRGKWSMQDLTPIGGG